MEEWLRWLAPNHVMDDATVNRFRAPLPLGREPRFDDCAQCHASRRRRAGRPTHDPGSDTRDARDRQPHRAREQGRYIAERIPGATLVELPLADHMIMWEAADLVIENIEGFARQIRDDEAEFDRVLATVLYTDIVD